MKHTLEIPAVAIKNAFAGLSKVIINKSALPVLGCVRVEADTNGITRFQATDLNSFATCRVQGKPGGFPACLIPFDALNRIIKGVRNSLCLVQEDGKLTVQSSFGTATVAQSLATHPLDEWPGVPQVPEPTFTGDTAFKKALREAFECVSTNSSRYIINGACVDLTDPACHSVVGTDGRHLFSANTFQFSLPKSVIIPSRKFLGWSGFSDDGDWLVALSLNKDGDPEWVQLQSDHWTFMTKPIEGTYPNWRHVVPSENSSVTTVTLNEQAIELMLEVIPHLPGKDDRFQPVSLVVENRSFHLSAIGGDEKKPTQVPIPGATVTGSDARILLDRTFVSKALRFGLSSFEMSDELSPIVFTATGRKLVAMPLHPDRVNPAPAEATPAPEAKPQIAAPATPSAEQPEQTPTETRKTMPAENTLTPPRRGNLQPNNEGTHGNHNNGANGHNGSALAGAITQIETVKTGLRDVIVELNTTIDLLRAAEREKKASAKEVESVRATLRSLQKVAI